MADKDLLRGIPRFQDFECPSPHSVSVGRGVCAVAPRHMARDRFQVGSAGRGRRLEEGERDARRLDLFREACVRLSGAASRSRPVRPAGDHIGAKSTS